MKTLTQEWKNVFPQERTLVRARNLAFGMLCGVGRRTITRSLCFQGRDQEEWSADYKVFSRSPWDAQDLFDAVWKQAVPNYAPKGYIAIGIDDTGLARTGKKVPKTTWLRSPMSPPFHPNLTWGHRFIQASLLLPLYDKSPESSARALPLAFQEATPVRKPKKTAPSEVQEAYKKARKEHNLSVAFCNLAQTMRQKADQAGFAERPLMIVGDGSFCNKKTYSMKRDRSELLTRARKDLRLSRQNQSLSPEAFYLDEKEPFKEAQVYYGGARITVHYKECEVKWDALGKKAPASRLIVVKPLGYRVSKNARLRRREPTYLLCTDLTTAIATLLQHYFDRWEIEVNHRDEKSILGVGEAQVWSDLSVPRVPPFLVAMYSLLLLAGLMVYGVGRDDKVFTPLPCWRKNARRASCIDLVRRLRKEIDQQKRQMTHISDYATMLEHAAA